MSLTSHLKHKGAVYSWMRAQFPIVNRRSILSESRPTLKAATTHLPTLNAKAEFKYPYAIVGTAIDYRLRLHFAPFHQNLVAHHGARILSDKGLRTQYFLMAGLGVPSSSSEDSVPSDIIDQFFADLDLVVARLAPAGRMMSAEEERELARYCFALAHFESIYRAGPWINSPLRGADSPQSVEELLNLCAPEVANDMAALSRLFGKNCGDLIALGAGIKQNPTFAGSALIGGADADFIADSCLWDIKTTIKSNFGGEWIYQLLGYVLLDFEDEYRIREIGIYMARQSLRLQWSLEELLETLCETGTAPLAFEARLAWLRAEFRTLLENMEIEREIRRAEQRAIANKQIEEMRAQEERRRQIYEAELAAKAEQKRAAARERRRLKKLAQ